MQSVAVGDDAWRSKCHKKGRSDMPNAGELIVFQMFYGVICGIIAAVVASKKGRNVPGWVCGSFFLGLIGLVILACLPNLIAERAYRQHVEEALTSLRKDSFLQGMQAEAFRKHATSRADAHDGALGIDTRSLDPVPDLAAMGLAPEKPPEEVLAKLAAKRRESESRWLAKGERQAPGDGGYPAQDASAVDPG